MVALQEEYLEGHIAGLDMATGDPINPADEGIWDNYRVKRQLLNSWCVFLSLSLSPPFLASIPQLTVCVSV